MVYGNANIENQSIFLTAQIKFSNSSKTFISKINVSMVKIRKEEVLIVSKIQQHADKY